MKRVTKELALSFTVLFLATLSGALIGGLVDDRAGFPSLLHSIIGSIAYSLFATVVVAIPAGFLLSKFVDLNNVVLIVSSGLVLGAVSIILLLVLTSFGSDTSIQVIIDLLASGSISLATSIMFLSSVIGGGYLAYEWRRRRALQIVKAND